MPDKSPCCGWQIYLASSWKNEEMIYAFASHLRDKGFDCDAFVDASNGRYVFHFSEIENADQLDAQTFLLDSIE